LSKGRDPYLSFKHFWLGTGLMADECTAKGYVLSIPGTCFNAVLNPEQSEGIPISVEMVLLKFRIAIGIPHLNVRDF
jgi:hypothetical protein